MKLPSLASFVNKAVLVFRRFPAVLVLAITGAIFGIRIVHLPYNQDDTLHHYLNIVQSCYLGVLLLLAITVFAESRQFSRLSNSFLQLTGIAVIIIYYYLLPDHFQVISMIRFILYVLGLHWLIAFIAHTGSGEMNGFWQYNKTLLLRILTACLYSSVLYLGLSLALLAIDKLFKVDVNYKYYSDLWCVLAGVFNTWFFLAGFPDKYASMQGDKEYPRGLKIFTQYVLLPIITLYLLILYAYMFRIIVTARWPVGWVSYLVLGFSIGGILSLLLIHPVRNEASNKWILVFSRFFYFALLPLIVLLFFAVAKRVNNYGITELRYFVLLLAFWLSGIAIYFLLSKSRDIRLIPVSLCLLAFLSSFGPWGAFSISKNSQMGQLGKLFEKYKITDQGNREMAGYHASFADRKKISSITEYLVETHGYQSMQPFFSRNLDSVVKQEPSSSRNDAGEQVKKLLFLLHLEYINSYQSEDKANASFSLQNRADDYNVNIAGYQTMIPDYRVSSAGQTDRTCDSFNPLTDSVKAGSASTWAGSSHIEICFDHSSNILDISDNKSPYLKVDLGAMIRSLQERGSIVNASYKQEDMILAGEAGGLRCKVILKSIWGNTNNNKVEIDGLTAYILVGHVRN